MEQEEAKRAIRLSSSVSKKSCHGLELQETGIVRTLIGRTKNQKSRSPPLEGLFVQLRKTLNIQNI